MILTLSVNQMFDEIAELQFNENAAQDVVDDLEFLMDVLLKKYSEEKIHYAINGVQPINYEDEEFEQYNKKFQKLKREEIYDIVGTMCYMSGMVAAERTRLRKK